MRSAKLQRRLPAVWALLISTLLTLLLVSGAGQTQARASSGLEGRAGAGNSNQDDQPALSHSPAPLETPAPNAKTAGRLSPDQLVTNGNDVVARAQAEVTAQSHYLLGGVGQKGTTSPAQLGSNYCHSYTATNPPRGSCTDHNHFDCMGLVWEMYNKNESNRLWNYSYKPTVAEFWSWWQTNRPERIHRELGWPGRSLGDPMILLNGDHVAIYAGSDNCIVARGDGCTDPAGCGNEGGDLEWGVVKRAFSDSSGSCTAGFAGYLDIDWGAASPAVLYGSPYRAGSATGYDPNDWYDLPAGFYASSLTLASDIAVTLWAGSKGQTNSACITLDHSIDDFGSYFFSDGSSVNDGVRSIEVVRNACPILCGTKALSAGTQDVASTSISSPQAVCSAGAPCGSPWLNSPYSGYTTESHTITFSWDDLWGAYDCRHSGYNFRVRTTPNMDTTDPRLPDRILGGTTWTETFSSDWDDILLYWSVRAANAPDGAEWSPARQFTISPNKPPSCDFLTANGSSVPSGNLWSREDCWTFQGTARDQDGSVARVEFVCSGDTCGGSTTDTAQFDGYNWSYSRCGLKGYNRIHFVAVDNQNASTPSSILNLKVDQHPPITILSLNGESNPARWPAWWSGPVQVRLQAQDTGNGQAIVGTRETHHQQDGGGWQILAGSDTSFTVAGDGSHTVEYYAVDQLDNSEQIKGPVSFQLDQTSPEWTPGFSEVHGLVSDIWQKDQNTPTFAWSPATDATSGLRGYQLYFGTDVNGTNWELIPPCNPCQWTPQPGGVRTGTHYLRGSACDNAGNCTPWPTQPFFVFRFDGAPPENPTSATHASGITNDTWQRTTNVANFNWPVPHDEGSGIKGYYVYWGTALDGTDTGFTSAPTFQDSSPLCGATDACTGYLRMRSVDNVDIPANDWSTAFVLRYDGSPPVADFTINGSVTQTAQSLVTLDITATDLGSGVRAMRLGDDGVTWTDWISYTTQAVWAIPAISREWWAIYLQVSDAVSLTSTIISHTIYFDVNRPASRSPNFWLFDEALSAGSGGYASPTYTARGTLGQTLDSAHTNSLNYIVVSGYEAGSQAVPLVMPGHDEFNFVNSIFASGTVANTLRSPRYHMVGTLGELALPNNSITITSPAYQLKPGFLAAAPSLPAPTPTPTPGPPPPEPPNPNCPFPQISINDGALFTNGAAVTLSICAPWAVEMMLSNDGGFGGAQWEPYAESKPWTITAYGLQVLPRFVYAAFRNADGTVDAVYFDDIIYDPTPPLGSVIAGDSLPPLAVFSAAPDGAQNNVSQRQAGSAGLLRGSAPLSAVHADGSVDLYLSARDDNSGMEQMQVSASSAFTDTVWEPYSSVKTWTPPGGDGLKTAYVRFRDSAGNVSVTAHARFAVDTQPPTGSVVLGPEVLGPAVITTTLHLAATDNLSGVSDMRLSTDPAFTNAVWLPYTTTVTWLSDLVGPSPETVYVQYRDWADNVSEVYSDAYMVDTMPPVVHLTVEPGATLTRIVAVEAIDIPAGPAKLRVSNDPMMIDAVVSLPYVPNFEWTFDERRVVWVQVADSVGNWSEPYPGYAAPDAVAASVSISLVDGNPKLTWTHLDVNAYYQIWRDTAPYFAPAAPTADTVKLDDWYPSLGGGTMTYTDTSADPNATYYYTVVSANALGQTSGPSNYVGLFRFDLTPGQ